MPERILYIDPVERSIRECEMNLTQEALDDLLKGRADQHWIVPRFLPDHEGWVDAGGLVVHKQIWFFHQVFIWGPMVVCGTPMSSARCTLEALRMHVEFSPIDRLG